MCFPGVKIEINWIRLPPPPPAQTGSDLYFEKLIWIITPGSTTLVLRMIKKNMHVNARKKSLLFRTYNTLITRALYPCVETL